GLTVVFLSTQVLFAHSPEKNLWDQRRKTIQFANASLGVLPPPSAFKKIEPVRFQVPSSSNVSSLVSLLSVDGVVRDVKAGKTQRSIIYIQDIHGQPEAQKNISSMILKLLAVDPRAVIGLEGAAGRIPMESLRKGTLEINKEVGSFFFNAGFI